MFLKSVFLKQLIFLFCFSIIKFLFFSVGNKISFLNVGQGDSMFLKHGRYKLVIDGGPNFEFDRHIDNYFFLNFCNLDLVVLTHADYDHVKGLNRILSRCNVNRVVFNNSDKQSKEYAKFLDHVSNVASSKAHAGDYINLGDLRIKVLWPPKDRYIKKENNRSIVFELNYKDLSFLLMGDIEQEFHNELDVSSAVDILKLAHHGALNGLNREFYKKVNPSKCVISVGEQNRYNHPAEEVVSFVQNNGCMLYRTDLKGTTEFFY